ILARPIERSHYLIGKFLGTLLTLLVFVCLNSGLLLFAIGALSDRSLVLSFLVPICLLGVAALVGWKKREWRTWLPLPLGLTLLVVGAWFSAEGIAERGVILGQVLLTMMEVSIVAAISLLFASFSSPFLTAIFTLCVFVVGRSADTLAKLPEHLFGAG